MALLICKLCGGAVHDESESCLELKITVRRHNSEMYRVDVNGATFFLSQDDARQAVIQFNTFKAKSLDQLGSR